MSARRLTAREMRERLLGVIEKAETCAFAAERAAQADDKLGDIGKYAYRVGWLEAELREIASRLRAVVS